jgi:hypothetical protein
MHSLAIDLRYHHRAKAKAMAIAKGKLDFHCISVLYPL